MIKRCNTLFLLVLTLFVSTTGWADIETDWGAFIQNDLRAAIHKVDTPGFNRNQTALGLDLAVELVPNKLRFIGDVQFVWTGFTKDTEFQGLTTRETIAPYYLESKAAYLEVEEILPFLDLRIGRQIVQWGTADMFNPTNNLNALDLEDPLMFGETIANEMVRLDFNPGASDFIFTMAWVPVFQPSLLPASALLAVGDSQAEFPFENPSARLKAERVRNLYLRNEEYYDISAPNVSATMPEFSLANAQLGARMQFMVGFFDMSLSYYRGFDTIPVSTESYSTAEQTGEMTADGTRILKVDTNVKLVYPQKQVLGFDLAGQLPFLDDAGIWFEGAFVFPTQVAMKFDITEVVPSAAIVEGDVVSVIPFFKYTVGSDYTVNEHLFLTAQFIHGFPDEFGAHAIHDYWVAGADFKFVQERLLFRLFLIGQLPYEDDDLPLDDDNDGMVESFARGATNDGTISSLVIFPSITVKPVDGLELALGSYLLLGHSESKFGMAAAGASLAFFRARASF